MSAVVTLADGADAASVARALAARGLWVRRLESSRPSPSPDGTTKGDGGRAQLLIEDFSATVGDLGDIAGIADVARTRSPHPLVDAQPRSVEIAGAHIGAGAPPLLIAGPCAVESEAQIDRLADAVAARGARLLRGGAFKPRTSPHAFAGHGRTALTWLARAAKRAGLGVVTEALAVEDVAAIAEVADLVQIGSRNMQNFALLRAAGAVGRPLLLKRGAAATIEEWLLAAEHCLAAGAPAVLFCERGVRGFDRSTRNLFDLGAVALLAHALKQTVLADPSHAAGRRDLIVPLGRAALAAGAAGLLVEVHDDPGAALSDGPQALAPADLVAFA
jgi:3-deoxy-7-phosphoheptulonate synthase